METLKQEIVIALSKLPDTAGLNDIQATVDEVLTNSETVVNKVAEPVSFLEAAKEYAGCLKNAPKDLSINKAYFYGFGD